MTPLPAVALHPFAAVVPRTRRALRSLGLTHAVLPTGLDRASNGRMHLRAWHWRIGSLAELRQVRIVGNNAEIVNTLVVPRDPATLPVFAAELLVFSGVPRLVFLDLQVPGGSASLHATARAATLPLAERYARWQLAEPPPDWAVCASPGGCLYARPGAPEAITAMVQAHDDYLAAWIGIALTCTPHSAFSIRHTEPIEALHEYQQHHIAHTPVRGTLGKLFGAEWTERFLTDFLYGPTAGDSSWT